MSSRHTPSGREKHGIRQLMRRGVKWLKNAVKGPASPRLPLGDPEPLAKEPEKVTAASGPSTKVPDSEGKKKTEAKKPKSAVAWNRLDDSLRALETGVELFPPLKSAVGAFIECLDIVQQAAENRADYDQLASEFQSMAEILKRYTGELGVEPSSGSIANIAECIQRQVADIKRKQDAGTARRLLNATHDQGDVISCYRQVGRLFRQLQYDLSMRTTKELKVMNERTLLQCIAPVNEARYNSSYSDTIRRHGCTAETREAIHEALRSWTTNPRSEKIYWMNGMAGTGKTTIAYSYCEWLKSTHRLGASFFCSRISSTCRSLSQIVPTVAYQLAHYSSAFRSKLCDMLNDDPVAGKLNVGQQFEKLMHQPLSESKNAIPDSVVVVIDALDECDDNYSVRLLLDVLLKFAEQLPLKFFVASRPEPIIRDRMMCQGGSSRYIVHLHDIEQSIVEEDIKKYLTEALSPMKPPPSQAQIELLAKRSRNLFIYAATVVRYIYPDDLTVDSSSRLELMLDAVGPSNGMSDDRYEALDLLYTTVLSAALESRLTHDEKDRVRRVLWTVVCAREPIPAATIGLLATLTEDQVMSALQLLRSVVHVPENSSLISPLHASFPEYMLAESRSKRFHCNESKSNETLAHRCFEVMGSELRFNICALESSYFTDDKVQDLEARVARCISPTLSYACRYWSSHLRPAPKNDATGDLLVDFLSNRLLFWMEVLSLSRCIGIGAPMMQQAQTWLQQSEDKQNVIQKQVSDARNFITWFAGNPCSKSTPHIYISALAFCARSSWVHQHYSQRTQGMASLSVSEHEEAVLAIWNVGYEVLSLAISPNGDHIATGGKDGSVKVYDIHTGSLVAGPFHIHTDMVVSVTFSPLEAHIASASNDTTIIVWDALTGRVLTGPLRGHTDCVQSVAFSPDGKRIVSGSDDHTTIIWDVSTGRIALGPLQGHTGDVYSVCFSPTGKLVASCSYDRSIKIWNAQTGVPVAIFEGHMGRTIKTAFSPDGSRLASCSFDKTILLWDMATRTAIRQPLTGHKSGIWSLAFSSDNVHIVSGGDKDNSIIVWNSLTGLPVLGPLSGHSDAVKSVVFSPDNSRIVSCSMDQTVRIWDIDFNSKVANQESIRDVSVGPVAFLPNHTQFLSNSSNGSLKFWEMRSGNSTTTRFEGQTKPAVIHSLAISTGGTCVAVGTNDGTIQCYNLSTGNLNAIFKFQPLKGHKGSIQGLSFSPRGAYLCSGSSDATIIVWDIEKGTMVGQPYQGHTGAVVSVTYSPDGARIASGGTDHTVRVWDPSTGEPVHSLKGHQAPVSSVAFSPSGGYIISGSVDGAIRRWEAGTGNCSDPLFEPHGNRTFSHCISFNPDGDQLASGFGSSIRLVDVRNMKLISKWELPQPEQTRWIGYSDGTDLISVSIAQEAPNEETKEEVNQHSPNIIRVWRADATPDQPASPSTPRSWLYKRDGRVSSSEGFVMWIPPDLVPHLKAHMEIGSPSFYTALFLSPDRFTNIGYPDLCIGERWAECYIDKDQVS
ncbi:unnamed protein product [Rhizoctonia solani]|uniref:Nephrocystin 3-like N-terminal domain-containing protein n=1 Tax=Rhizoctonia solani TaxID=456999 RepID=A0A8H3DVP6_9AGAM|nr:unnamed protein product [Rhizoctonia solani]